ncbi:MAG: hypothetical protein IJR80_06410 [Treponema sp.]|nr:hypothetical protein [Treponema sp.]
MKKIIKLLATISLLAPFFFAGCDNPACYGVSNDVVSEDATVSGNIAQITRYTASGTEFLIVNADDGMRYKRADNRSHGSWKTYGGLPFSLHSYDYYGEKHNGEQIIKIVADSEYLYILSTTYKNDNDEGTVAPDVVRLRCAKITSNDGQNLDGTEWKTLNESKSGDVSAVFKIYKYSSTGYYYSAFSLLSTNSLNPAHRKVFVRSGKYGAVNTDNSTIKTPVYYDVSSSGLTKTSITKAWNGTSTVSDLTKNNVYGVAWFNNAYTFFTQPAVATNECYTNYTYTALASNTTYQEPTVCYFGYNSSLCYLKSDGTTGSIGANRTITALAVCADSILIGMGTWDASTGYNTYGGITKSDLKDGVPQGTSSFKTNAESQITSGYHVYALLNANPAEAELASALYAAIGFAGSGSSTGVAYSSIGLWSYYPSRGNWNRE